MHNRYYLLAAYTLPLWLLGVLVCLLHVINPVASGPWGIMAVFLVVYLLVASVLFTTLHLGFKLYGVVLKRRGVVSVHRYHLSVKRAYYIASIVAFGPVMLLALQSMRQLEARDIVLVVIFLLVASFYASKKSL